MITKKITFTNDNGEKLAARLQLPPDQKPVAYALFAHCFTCNKNLNAVRNISSALTQKGFGVFRFDFTGLGESEGDFEDTNFSSNVEDLICAAGYMEHELQSPKLIIGHSLGGAAAIYAGHAIKSIEAIATIAAPATTQHVKHLFGDQLEAILEEDKAVVNLGGRPFTIKKQFINDLNEQNLSGILKQLRKPILILHSPQDNTVGIKNAADIYNQAMHPKSFISLDGADHLLSNKEDSMYAGSVISSWAQRYINKPKVELLTTDQQVVAQIGNEGFTTQIKAGNHSLTADEPVSVGGNDFGPGPYDLVLSGLGACTAMTMRMYADRKKWEIDEINVHLKHGKDYVKDCEDCDKPDSKMDVISRQIKIIGNLNNDQLKRLMEIADKCPVHRTLENHVHIQTERV